MGITSGIPLPKWPIINLPSKTTPPDVSKQYTPPNWQNRWTNKHLYAITFSTTDSPLYSANFGPGFNPTTQTAMFVFDALKRAHHSVAAEVTQHPVQSGYNISDHVIMQPFTLTLEVAMSDAIAMYSLPAFTPMWSSNASKAVSAFLQMKQFMESRQIMTINTRLYTYTNMILREISTEDSARTYFGGLSMVLTFQQIIIADVAAVKQSQRIQTVGDTKKGTTTGTTPSKTTVDQHKVPKAPGAPLITVPGIIPGADAISNVANALVKAASVPGAGMYTSVVLGVLKGLIP